LKRYSVDNFGNLRNIRNKENEIYKDNKNIYLNGLQIQSANLNLNLNKNYNSNSNSKKLNLISNLQDFYSFIKYDYNNNKNNNNKILFKENKSLYLFSNINNFKNNNNSNIKTSIGNINSNININKNSDKYKSEFFYKHSKKKFSNSNNLSLKNFAYLDDIPQSLKELEEYNKRNSINLNIILSNRYELFEDEKNFNYELFTFSIYLNNFSNFPENKKKANNNIILEYLRKNNYSILNGNKNGKHYNKEKSFKLFELLYMLKLTEADKEALFNFYFTEKNNKNFTNEDLKRLINAIYFFEISGVGNKLTKIKKDLLETIKLNYKNFSPDDVYYFNSYLIYLNPSDIANLFNEISQKFSEIFEVNNQNQNQNQKFSLMNSIGINYNNYNKISFEQKLMNFLLIPKLIYESKNSFDKKQKLRYEKNQIEFNSNLNSHSHLNTEDYYPNSNNNTYTNNTNLSNNDNFNSENINILEKEIIIYEKNLENNLKIFENFLLELINKEELNSYNSEILLSAFSNYINYSHMENPINDFDKLIEIFCNKIHTSLASLTNENYIELFFMLLNIFTMNEIKITPINKKLFIEVYKILSKIKSNEPRVFLDVDKFYIYLNSSRANLSNAFVKFNYIKDKDKDKDKENNLKDYYRQLDSFRKIVRLSIDLFPFSIKNKEYSSDLLNNQFKTFLKFLE
jgi:hypothetical protein